VELLPIGQFARLTGLTVRAIRHYGELGLLRPAYVDSDTGYRYYTSDQIKDAAAIRRLRFLELALDEIQQIVDTDDRSFTHARLVRHRAKMAELAATTEKILTTLQRLIEGEEELVPSTADICGEIEIKEVPAQPALVISERIPHEKLPEVIPAAIDAVHAHMESVGAAYVGPPFILCPHPDDDGMVELETGWPVAGSFPGGGRVEFTTLPPCTVLSYRHHGPYSELHRSYGALTTLIDDEGLTTVGVPREIYSTDPKEVLDPSDWVTEIQLPIVSDAAMISALTGARSD
jgi:DNA-binding transcriptional MerR regulator/effector-binding domain-containing protein